MKSDEIRLGWHTEDGPTGPAGEPLLLNRELLKDGHMHVRGRTRSGKTSLSVAPLALQLLKPYQVLDDRGRVAEENARDAVFVFDMGGDLALFHTLRNECAESYCRRTFRFLSLDERDDWHYFDPLQAVPPGKDKLIRFVNLLIEAFHLDHGLVYGGSYYTARNVAALLRVVTRLLQQHSEDAAGLRLEDIAAYLDQHRERDEDQIRMTFQFLLHYEQLKRPPEASAERQIDMGRALEESEVVYFLTPTLGEATTARQIAGLGLYTLVNAAMQRARRGLPPRHAWVFVDEFQELAGRSFAALLAQASKFGISLIMANQTTTQLENRDVDLAQIVADNTILKQYFTCTSERDTTDLQFLSKEETTWLSRTTQSLDGKSSVAEQEVREPKLKKDTILDLSSTHMHSFLVLDDGRGHKEPIPLRGEFEIAAENYRRYKYLPPPSHQGPRVSGELHGEQDSMPLWKRARAGRKSAERQALLTALVKAKRLGEQALQGT